MKLSKNTYSILLILLSLSYIFYLTYINVNNLFVGATANVNNKNQIEITKVSDYTMAYYAGVKKGDIVIKINQNKSVEPKDLKQNTLKNVRSMTVERSGEIVDLKNLSLLSEDNLFVYLIPVIFFFVCLSCIILILKINKEQDSVSAFILIIFLLTTGIAYVSAGGSSKGDIISRYVNVITLISVPVNYLLFIYQYIKEFGYKIFNGKVFVALYTVPVINIILEFFRHCFERGVVGKVNLVSISLLYLIALFFITVGLIKYKKTEQANILKTFLLINIFAFSPFVFLYVAPYIIFNDYYVSSFLVAPFLLLIPFSLVYQFMTNKIYEIDFIIGRLKYYSLLAVTPTLLIITIYDLVQDPNSEFYTFKLTLLTYIIMLAVFYSKEILDFRFRLKRFSEKHNYQDSIFKFTQIIKGASSLKQVFTELESTLLEVLMVSKVCVLEVEGDLNVRYFFNDNEKKLWEPYSHQLAETTSEIGKIVQVDKGFLMKVGERGTKSYIVLCLSFMNTPKLTWDEISWLKTLSFYTSITMENVLKIEELMNHLEDLKKQETNPVWLKKLMFTIEEKQRSDLARDLHDSVLQDLISLKRQCELFLADFKKEEPCQLEVQDKLHQMNEQMSDVILMTRETCHELRPQLLYDLGLVKAVSKLAAQQQERAPFHIRLNTGRFTAALDLDTQLNLYRIIQEFLSNAMKHSQANEVLIMLISIQNKVILHYEDDGVGCNQEEGGGQSMSMGLSGIKERVRALDGRMKIDTSEGNGFKVDIEMEL
ncbi:histidine kinase [Bacillus velezensis]|uniref:histidine kinase n=1 Tax=Bacillus velezensis TaxID=492670 RepID=UPI002E20352D|nr:histidine kinase [Bacillus velezensis]MED3334557.1 histidine kinase [Bacillus velezensis]MED3676172.1 histidine kinase [Bacillus velezensis]